MTPLYNNPKATHRYRCHLKAYWCQNSDGSEREMVRHSYSLEPTGSPDVPGDCNDDCGGEDPDYLAQFQGDK